VERGRHLIAFHALKLAGTPEEGQRIVAGALPPLVAFVLEPAQLEFARQRLLLLLDPGERPRLRGEDWRGGLAVFLLVFVSTLPVVVPFLVMQDAHRALRVSNGIAIAMLFLCGYAVGRLTRYRAWVMGLGMVLIGAALVSMTMALGG